MATTRGVADRGTEAMAAAAVPVIGWTPPPIMPSARYLNVWLDYAKQLYIQAVTAWDWSVSALRSHHLGLLALAARDAEAIRAAHTTPGSWWTPDVRDKSGARWAAGKQWDVYEVVIRSIIAGGTDPEAAIETFLLGQVGTYPDSLYDLKLATRQAYGSPRHEWEMGREQFRHAWNRLHAAAEAAPAGLLVGGLVMAVTGAPQGNAQVEAFLDSVDLAENILGPALDYGGTPRGVVHGGNPTGAQPGTHMAVPAPAARGAPSARSTARGISTTGTARAPGYRAEAVTGQTTASPSSPAAPATTTAPSSSPSPAPARPASTPAAPRVSDVERGLEVDESAARSSRTPRVTAPGAGRDYTRMKVRDLQRLSRGGDDAAAAALLKRYEEMSLAELRQHSVLDPVAHGVLVLRYEAAPNAALGQYARYDPLAAAIRAARRAVSIPFTSAFTPPAVPPLEATNRGPHLLEARATVLGSGRPGPGEALVGTSRKQMSSASARRILRDPNHHLRFVLGPDGRFFRTQQKGQTRDVLADEPRYLQMGHMASHKGGGPEYLMLQLAHTNQLYGTILEHPRLGGLILGQHAVSIGGIAVELETALLWDQYAESARANGVLWLPPGVVQSAPLIRLP